jgi:hypothetical protein
MYLRVLLETKALVLCGLPAVLLVAGCKRSPPPPPLNGHFHVVLDSKPVEMKCAYAVARGDKSVRLLVSNVARDCAWALANGTAGPYEKGELRGTFDLAEVYAPDGGSSWQVARGGFAGDPYSGWGNSTSGESRHWPAVVVRSGAGCATHVAVTGKQLGVNTEFDRHTALEVDADLVPVCCPNVAEPPPATMTVRIGSDVYPLGRAAYWAPDGIRVTRISDPCFQDDEEIVLFVPQGPQPSPISIFGNVLPSGRIVNNDVRVDVDPSHERLTLHGGADLAMGDADAGMLHVDIDGDVALTGCPGLRTY